MGKCKRWTKEEDQVLVQLIEKNPHNLSNAFLMASGKLERTQAACRFRWQEYLRHKDEYKNIFIIVSKRRKMTNGKNCIRGKSKRKPKNNKVSVWKKILSLLGL